MKNLQEGTPFLWRLHFQTLLVAFFHGHLLKVVVMLKVNGNTELFGN